MECWSNGLKAQHSNVPVLQHERLGFELNEGLDKDAVLVNEFGSSKDSVFRWFRCAKDEKSSIGRTMGSALG